MRFHWQKTVSVFFALLKFIILIGVSGTPLAHASALPSQWQSFTSVDRVLLNSLHPKHRFYLPRIAQHLTHDTTLTFNPNNYDLIQQTLKQSDLDSQVRIAVFEHTILLESQEYTLRHLSSWEHPFYFASVTTRVI